MGVDYSAHWGFGVRAIKTIPKDRIEECEGDFLEYLEQEFEHVDGLDYFEVGNNYGGDETDIYIVSMDIQDALNDQVYDLIGYVHNFKEKLKLLRIEYEGQPSIVGGLEIW